MVLSLNRTANVSCGKRALFIPAGVERELMYRWVYVDISYTHPKFVHRDCCPQVCYAWSQSIISGSIIACVIIAVMQHLAFPGCRVTTCYYLDLIIARACHRSSKRRLMPSPRRLGINPSTNKLDSPATFRFRCLDVHQAFCIGCHRGIPPPAKGSRHDIALRRHIIRLRRVLLLISPRLIPLTGIVVPTVLGRLILLSTSTPRIVLWCLLLSLP